MPRNGSGLFVLAEPPFINGTATNATAMNSDLSDIATGLTNSIAKDGQTPWTGNQNANGHKVTGLASGTTSGDAVQFGQFAPSVGSNGYSYLPGGVLLQWGRGDTDASGLLAVTFPVAFSSTDYTLTLSHVVPAAGSGGSITSAIVGPTIATSGVTVQAYVGGSPSTNRPMRWFSIGPA
ncbi:MAG: hypothetical protein AB7F35_26370 [Acetobacteraceae bacterium]